MTTAETILAIKDGPENPAVKVARILSYRDGGFAVLVPYHPVKSGVISKIKLRATTTHLGGVADVVESNRAEGLVKLSIHPSGFAQFSSAGPRRIRSGMGPFMIPKGVGLHCKNLLDPIDTGPTFLIETNDLSRFERLLPGEKTPVALFAEGDFFERDRHDLRSAHVYWIEGFVLPGDVLRRVVPGPRGLVLRQQYGVSRPEWQVDFRVLASRSPLVTVGIVVSRIHRARASLVSGYSINSPKDLTMQFVLTARYVRGESIPDVVGDLTYEVQA